MFASKRLGRDSVIRNGSHERTEQSNRPPDAPTNLNLPGTGRTQRANRTRNTRHPHCASTHGARRTHALYTYTLMSHHMGTAGMWWSRGGSFLTKPLRTSTGWYAALQGRLSSHAEDVACRTGVPHENDCTRLTVVFSGSCTPSTFACGPPASAVPFGFCTT